MMAAQGYVKGQHVGFVDVSCGRAEVPLPRRWYVLQVKTGRDAKVMEAFDQRGVCGYSPTITRFVDRRTGGDARASHLGRRVVRRMLPGLIFVPDFDVSHEALEQKKIDYVEGWLKMTIAGAAVVDDRSHDRFAIADRHGKAVLPSSALASMSNLEMQVIREIEAGAFQRRFGTRGQRRASIGDTVRIVAGPLSSFAARVEQLDSRGRLKVFVDALMRGVSVTLSETQVEPV